MFPSLGFQCPYCGYRGVPVATTGPVSTGGWVMAGHLPGLMTVWLLVVAVDVLVKSLTAVLLGTLVGVPLGPRFTTPLYNAASGYLLGGLGRDLAVAHPTLLVARTTRARRATGAGLSRAAWAHDPRAT